MVDANEKKKSCKFRKEVLLTYLIKTCESLKTISLYYLEKGS